MLIGYTFPLNCCCLYIDIPWSILTSTPPLFWSVSSSPSKPHPPPSSPASQGTPRHRSNLSGINVIHNPPCLHSAPDWLHSGQFPFYPADISGLRSHLFRCIRIGNSILCQSLLSSQHRQTFHICIQTEGEGDCTSVGEGVFVGGNAVESHVSTHTAGFCSFWNLLSHPHSIVFSPSFLLLSSVSDFSLSYPGFPRCVSPFTSFLSPLINPLLVVDSFGSRPITPPSSSAQMEWICNPSTIYSFSLSALLPIRSPVSLLFPPHHLPLSGATLPLITEDQRLCQRHLMVN